MTDVRELDSIPELLSAAIDPLTRPPGGTRLLGRPVAPRLPLTDARFLAGQGASDVDVTAIPSPSGLRHDDHALTVTPTRRVARRRNEAVRAGIHQATRPRRTSVGERPLRDPDGTGAPDGASPEVDGGAGTTGGRRRAAAAPRRPVSGDTDASPRCRN